MASFSLHNMQLLFGKWDFPSLLWCEGHTPQFLFFFMSLIEGLHWFRKQGNRIVCMNFGVSLLFQLQCLVTLGKPLWVQYPHWQKYEDQGNIIRKNMKNISQAAQVQVFNKCWL